MLDKYISSLKFHLFTGLRYINSRKNRKKPNIIFIALFAGVSLGLMVLIIVLGIMNGFQENHISRMIEIGSYHASVSRKDMKSMTTDESNEIKNKLYSLAEIEASVPYTDKEIIIKTDKKEFNDQQIIKLRAIDALEVDKDRHFARYFKIRSGSFDLSGKTVLLGEALSYRIITKTGGKVFLTQDIGIGSFRSDGIEFTVKGFFYTESYDYDRYWCFISLDSLKYLSGSVHIDNIGIKFKDKRTSRKTIKKIEDILGDTYIVQSAEEINRGFFAALKIEKAIILFIFGMIFLMIATNTFGALKLTMIEKKSDISILKALGAKTHNIEIIFLIESLLIGFLGCLTGTVLGFFVVYNVTNFFKLTEFLINSILSFISFAMEFIIPGLYFNPVILYDPSIYYRSEFLVKLNFSEIAVICAIIIAMITLAAYMPVRKASKLKPNEIIKN